MPSTKRDDRGKIRVDSLAMRALRRLGRDDLAWTLRRLHVPVSPDALVLEVGSGGNPFPRSNVLLDAYESTRERHFQPLVRDRPMVLGFMENLPFKDNAFDFVIACHVIEHSMDVVACLGELQRVALAGYIETPDAFFERINPYYDHRLELTLRDGVMRIRPKRSWCHDRELYELYRAQVQPSPKWGSQFRTNPFAFHMRYFWSRDSGGIRYEILDGKCHEPIESHGEEPPRAVGTKASLRQLAVRGIRRGLSQLRRNQSIDLLDLLRCPGCHAALLQRRSAELACVGCGRIYPSPRRDYARMVDSGRSMATSKEPQPAR